MLKLLINKIQHDYRIKAGYGVAFVLLLTSYILTLVANAKVQEQGRQVNHSNSIIQQIEGLMSYLKDAETSVRGFGLMREESFLKPYFESLPLVSQSFDFLKKETKNNSPQQVRLITLKRMIDQRFLYLGNAYKNFKDPNFRITDSIRKGPFKGKMLMDSIRSLVNEIKYHEETDLSNSSANLKSNYLALNTIIITSLVLAFLFAALGFITYLRENKARKEADEKVVGYQQQLEMRIKELDEANKELNAMRLSEKFAATGRIARSIAHEVRNPLTNIDLATSQILAEYSPVDGSMQMLFEMVNRNSKRINQLITELLTATRFAELNYQPVSLNELAEAALQLAEDRLQLKQIAIEKKLDPQLPLIAADREKMIVALLNLLLNAIEAIEDGDGLIVIGTRVENGLTVIQIQDNGVGMGKEALSRLFEPYFTTKNKGNGLGLTNTQNIILNHKGTVQVESEQGKGTTFTIRFQPLDNP